MAIKTSPPADPSAIRLKEEDKAAVKFIQDELSMPGLPVNFTDAVRRSIHAYANELKAKKKDRRKEKA